MPPGVHSHALLPIGYPMGRFGPVRSVALADVVYEDQWGKRHPEPITGGISQPNMASHYTSVA